MCGIFSYSGKNFNKYKFNILGLYNDTRGGDSCGVVINTDKGKQVEYGHGQTKLYSKFIESGVNLNFDKVNFAIGHCRKASVGGVGEAQAQPVVLTDKDGNIEFIMVHNGTMFNYRQLADKYNVEYNLLETDSQIFCKTLYYGGYKVLGEYDGAGSFIIWDKRDGDDTIKVFKGASKYYINDDTLYEERPLYGLHNKNSFWVSSMKESLNFINDNEYKVENLKSNTLYTIKYGKIIAEDKISRKDKQQIQQLVWKKGEYPVSNNYVARELPFRAQANYNYYGDWDEMDEIDWQNAYNSKDKKVEEKEIKPTLLSSNIIENPKKPPIQYIDKIYYDEDGLYKLNGEACHGEYKASIAGYIKTTTSVKTYYFVCGVMMKSYFDYLCAGEYCLREFGDDAEEVYPIYLSRYSTTPTPLEVENDGVLDGIALYYDDKNGGAIEFTGSYAPYFTFQKDIYEVKDGFIYKMNSYADRNEYTQDLDSIIIDDRILSGFVSDEKLMEMIEENI